MKASRLLPFCLLMLFAQYGINFPAVRADKTIASRTKPASEPVKFINSKGEKTTLYAGSYALVIGVSQYKHWPKLDGAAKDAIRVREALKEQGFDVTPLDDPDINQLRNGIKKFIIERGTGESNLDNRLIIYFAGHGDTFSTHPGERTGCILPIDAPQKQNGSVAFEQSIILMDEVEGYAKRIESKHALFVFDSCFSGTLFNGWRGIPPSIADDLANPVRQFITSAKADQRAADESIFCDLFIRGVKGEADYSKDGYVSGTELGLFLRTNVANYSPIKQTPCYGKIRDQKLDQGDFIFAPRDNVAKLKLFENEVKQTPDDSVFGSTFALPPPEAAWYYEKGLNAVRSGNYYQASKFLAEADRLGPNFPLTYVLLADALFELDEWDQARKLILKATSLQEQLPAIQRPYLSALSATATRDFTAAVEHYQTIAKQSQGNQFYVWFDLARAYEKNNQIKLAIENYQKALKLSPNNAAAHLRLGILFGRQQKALESEQAFSEAYRIYDLHGDVEGKAQVQYQRGFIANNNGLAAKAREIFEQAIKLARAAESTTLEALILLQMYHVNYKDGKAQEAEQALQTAMAIIKRNKLNDAYLRWLVDLGTLAGRQNKKAEAEKMFKEAIEIARSENALRNLARAQFQLADLLIQQGRADETIDDLQASLAFYQKGGYRSQEDKANILLARAKRMTGSYNPALEILDKLAGISSDPGNLSFIYEEKGMNFLALELHPEAMSAFQEELGICNKLSDQECVGYSKTYLANATWQMGLYSDASKLLYEVEKLAEEKKFSILKKIIYVSRAEMALSKRELPEAIEKIEKARELFAKEDNQYEIEYFRIRSIAEAMRANKDQALQFSLQALELAERQRSPYTLSKSYLARSQVMMAIGDAERALEFASKARSRFSAGKQTLSEWFACSIQLMASKQLGRKDDASRHALELLKIEGLWGEERKIGYSARPDVAWHKAH